MTWTRRCAVAGACAASFAWSSPVKRSFVMLSDGETLDADASFAQSSPVRRSLAILSDGETLGADDRSSVDIKTRDVTPSSDVAVVALAKAADHASGVPLVMQGVLSSIMKAKTSDDLQATIRAYRREAFELATTKEKAGAIRLLLDGLKVSTVRVTEDGDDDAATHMTDEEIEQWLSNEFLEESIMQHAGKLSRMQGNISLKDRVPPSLLSLGSNVHQKFRNCDWWVALSAFYMSHGSYGNFCGTGEHTATEFYSNERCGPDMTAQSKLAANAGHLVGGSMQVCLDSGLDEACFHHDHGRHSEPVFNGIAVKSLCEVDRQFKEARLSLAQSSFMDADGNAAQAAVVGANCLFDVMPCLRYENTLEIQWCPAWYGGYPCQVAVDRYVTKWPYGDYEADGCNGACYN